MALLQPTQKGQVMLLGKGDLSWAMTVMPLQAIKIPKYNTHKVTSSTKFEDALLKSVSQKQIYDPQQAGNAKT